MRRISYKCLLVRLNALRDKESLCVLELLRASNCVFFPRFLPLIASYCMLMTHKASYFVLVRHTASYCVFVHDYASSCVLENLNSSLSVSVRLFAS